MKFLSTFKITKGFDTWLNMYKEIQPDLEELGIKILWAGANADETKVFDIVNTKVNAKVITIASSTFTVTANAEQIPKTCLVIGLLSIKGSINILFLIIIFDQPKMFHISLSLF